MKGVILAGGKGTRLLPITKVTNKHLLPVYNKPMIYYPLETLTFMGIRDILIVSGPEHAGHFLHLLGSGREFGVRLSYEVQEEAGGIAQALGLAEDFADNGKVMAILGDNIFEDHALIRRAAQNFLKQKHGAKIFLKRVGDAKRFGVAEISGRKIVNIEEKPKKPKTNLAVTGLYMYDRAVFRIIQDLKPSGRGELEITDVNNAYVAAGTMTYQILQGAWTDAGTFESLLRATNLVAKKLRGRL
ncbi:NTP transferase domain-containing protein [Candidatus Azambacteria bacterium]|nr:NTP transferase domain-containing protein [Candidatus Azambacteria bacterium]